MTAPARFGFTVSKRTAKKAVERNRIRRRLKEAVRLAGDAHMRAPATTTCWSGAAAALTEPFADLQADLAGALRQSRPVPTAGRPARRRGDPIDEEQPERHHRHRAVVPGHHRAGSISSSSPKLEAERQRLAAEQARTTDATPGTVTGTQAPVAGAPTAAPSECRASRSRHAARRDRCRRSCRAMRRWRHRSASRSTRRRSRARST